ncbi:MAG: hypothetical protein ACOZQL_16275 [Myxococcota bacterium]
MSSVLKVAALVVALLFGLGVILTTHSLFFGSSKLRPLFGASEAALSGPADGGIPAAR